MTNSKITIVLTLLVCQGVLSAFEPEELAEKALTTPRSSAEIEPFGFDYRSLAFYPDRWTKAGVDFEMLAWEGENIVLVTQKGEYDAELITEFVSRLDQGWDVYRKTIGKTPRRFKHFQDKPTICALPKSNLSCGYGCGYVGATGIEASAFYTVDLPAFQSDAQSFQHYYFYEMGRNYFVFQDRHSLFTTGFAVFMRYVCMDQLGCKDPDARTRQTIEACEQFYANSDLDFFDCFTNLGEGEKSNRLRNENGQVVSPSDQPVMYATAMLKLRKICGGDDWVQRFYHRMLECDSQKARNIETSKRQIYNWLVCASAAAGRDLTPVFADRWRLPLRDDQRAIMRETSWDSERLVVSDVVDRLLAETEQRPVSLVSQSKLLPNVVPTPKRMTSLDEKKPFRFNRDSRILWTDSSGKNEPSLRELAEVVAEELEMITGIRASVVQQDSAEGSKNDIVLAQARTGEELEEVAQAQRYRLRASDSGVVIEGSDYKGVCFGTASLLQLINSDSLTIPALEIEDESSAAYRAVMIDVARKVHSVGVVEDVVRLCRLYKVRYLHLHMTDDQNFTFPFAPVTDNIKGNACYTMSELKGLVRYADARGVTIIPELDLPGHSTRLKQSGFLATANTDAEVASAANYDKINQIVDAMLDVFSSSPYFHIGGDESGAGGQLIPFLQAVNQRVRQRGKRLLIWEGFHGAPLEQLPAKGEDRVIVMSWESSYNAPWDLLESGYEVINASWKPMYLVSGYGGLIHAGAGGGCKRFALEDIYRWNKDTFMHWEPGRAVFEDRGPNDSDRTDHEWNARWIGKQDQILGGQLLYWEQREGSVVHYLRNHVPVMAERLWNPETQLSFEEFQSRAAQADQKVFAIVQPVEILPVIDHSRPVADLYQPYEGKDLKVTFRNRSKIEGQFRFAQGGFSGSLGAPNFRPIPKPDSLVQSSVRLEGAFGVRAELVRPNGSPVPGQTWSFYNNWPMRVRITEFDIGDQTYAKVPDLAKLGEGKIIRRFEMPYIRGLMQNVVRVGQMTEADLIAPMDGEYTFELRTQSGHATLFCDLNQNGSWEEDEVLIRDSPNTEQGRFAKTRLEKGQRYRIRIDHSTGMPRPVLNLLLATPSDEKPRGIDSYLSLPAGQ